jgi:hypothetical protein
MVVQRWPGRYAKYAVLSGERVVKRERVPEGASTVASVMFLAGGNTKEGSNTARGFLTVWLSDAEPTWQGRRGEGPRAKERGAS